MKVEGGKQKAESRRRKAEGGKQKAEGKRRKVKVEGRKQKGEGRRLDRVDFSLVCPGRQHNPRRTKQC